MACPVLWNSPYLTASFTFKIQPHITKLGLVALNPFSTHTFGIGLYGRQQFNKNKSMNHFNNVVKIMAFIRLSYAQVLSNMR